MECTLPIANLLVLFRPVFTAPTYSIFVTLVHAWILTVRRRSITELIGVADAQDQGHHSRFHNFFSRSAWSFDGLCKILAELVTDTFKLHGKTIRLSIDDTLCRKTGRSIFGSSMHYDPLLSSKSKTTTRWGHSWVILSILIDNPFWAPGSVWAIPVLFRLYRPKKANNASHKTRPKLGVELIHLLARWFPHCRFKLSADSAYSGESVLGELPANYNMTGRVDSRAAMYEPAPPRQPNQKGRPRKRGKRMSGMKEWAEDSTPWQEVSFDQYGLHGTFLIKVRKALYYKAGGERLLLIVLVRRPDRKYPDQMFYDTDVNLTGEQVLSGYGFRWSCEVMHRNIKQDLGFEDPGNRTEKAVERTAPMAMLIYSLLIVWYHKSGHGCVQFPFRPWYKNKSNPSFADILATIRRKNWQFFFWDGVKKGESIKNLMNKIIDKII